MEEITAARNAAQQEAQDLAVKLQVGGGLGQGVGREDGGTGMCCSSWTVQRTGICPACRRPSAASVSTFAELGWLALLRYIALIAVVDVNS